ncbi:MAG: thioredoxin domain-containing protein [Acidobacteria bacterium]|nr:thioredoxin domain-containing protein [Acidobacteriota bacterium]
MRTKTPNLGLLLLGWGLVTLACGAQTAREGKSSGPLAVVSGQPLSEKDLPPAAQASLIHLRFQEYQLLRSALEALIDQRLLEAEARKRNLTQEGLLQQEVDSKVPKAGVPQARTAYLQRLRDAAGVVILLDPPRVRISPDPARVKGNPEAPVTIAMFGDYQCPLSREMQPVLERVLERYKEQVRLAYLDFPQREAHPEAEAAAQAAPRPVLGISRPPVCQSAADPPGGIAGPGPEPGTGYGPVRRLPEERAVPCGRGTGPAERGTSRRDGHPPSLRQRHSGRRRAAGVGLRDPHRRRVEAAERTALAAQSWLRYGSSARSAYNIVCQGCEVHMPMKTLSYSLVLLGGSLLSPASRAQAPPKSGEQVAVVAGQPIYEKDLLPHAQSQFRQLRNQEYELKSRILEGLINQKLVEAEAKKKGIASEKLLEEIDSKVTDPTDGEVEAYYLGQKDRQNRPLDGVKAQVRQGLKQARVQEARQAYFRKLREKAEVAIFLRQPKIEVRYDPARLRGAPDAPVTIVEFSDFQCPFCQRVGPTLKEVLGKYEGKVRLAYRDFPLQQIHPQAQAAAEASRCAGEQGKFWDYHDLLFSKPGKLDKASLVEHAGALALDVKQFESCLAGGKFKAKVEEDLQEGTLAGVSGTPAFFINGVLLSGAQPAAAFEKIIEAELAAERKAAGR